MESEYVLEGGSIRLYKLIVYKESDGPPFIYLFILFSYMVNTRKTKGVGRSRVEEEGVGEG